MDLVRITSLELDCIVGIRAYERRREQRVRLDLALGVDARRAGRSGRIVQTVDYDLVAAHLIAMLRFRRYQLIEMAAEELCAMLLTTETELMHVHQYRKTGRARRACAVCVRRGDTHPRRLRTAALAVLGRRGARSLAHARREYQRPGAGEWATLGSCPADAVFGVESVGGGRARRSLLASGPGHGPRTRATRTRELRTGGCAYLRLSGAAHRVGVRLTAPALSTPLPRRPVAWRACR